MIDINQYQAESDAHRVYRGRIDHDITYPALGLSGEVGEFHEKIKKIFRDGGGQVTEEDRQGLLLELGDIMWHVVICAETLGFKMSDVLDANLKKLESRRRRNKTHGSGDHR